MSMNSFVEMYLTVFGWLMYDGIWETLTGTGLAFLPFLGLVGNSIIGSLERQEERSAWIASLKQIEIGVFTMLTVVVLAAQPLLNVSLSSMTYNPGCGEDPVASGSTSTTFDAVFTPTTIGGERATIPPWWLGVMRLSSGVTAAALTRIPCAPDLRQARFDLSNTSITDPQTRSMIEAFYDQCWAPAAIRMQTENIPLPAGIPRNDISWAGSRFFLANGFYDAPNQAANEIPGFAYVEARDGHFHNPGAPTPTFGHPVCRDWWERPGVGLRARLLAEINSQNVGFLQSIMINFGLGSTQTEDAAIRSLIEKDFNVSIQQAPVSNVSNLGSALTGGLGAKLEQLTLFPRVYMIQQAAPIGQAAVLMIIYAALPFILVFSSYSISAVIQTSIIIFAVKFLTVFWAMAKWLDAHLYEAILIGQGRGDVISRAEDFLFNFLDPIAKDIIDLTMAGLYIVVPLIWVFALGLAGASAGHQISNIIGQLTGFSGNAATTGSRFAHQTAMRQASGLGRR